MKQAVFDHVDDEGFLVLKIDDTRVRLDVSDELEHGILSSKQIKSEARDINTAPEPSALPISSIQTMVRQGISNTEIAQKYQIAETLVRRFAQPVETEKQYAIAQFLSVNAQTSAATRSMEDLITHNLQEAGVEPATVSWQATKQNRQPWKIVASFSRDDQELKATWMWNLRDNSVVSIDPAAKRLLGENASAGTLLFGEEKANASSRQIQAALNGRGPIPPAWLNEDAEAEQQSIAPDTQNAEVQEPDENSDDNRHADNQSAQEGDADTAGVDGSTGPTVHNTVLPTSQQASPDASSAQAAKVTKTEKTEKKPRRSSIPSWDDILFGD